MNAHPHILRNLTLRLESFAVFIPIPFAFYMVFVGSNADIGRLLPHGIISGSVLAVMILGSWIVRYLILRPFFAFLDAPQSFSGNDAEREHLILDIKRRLLGLPRIEAGLVGLRWVVGGIAALGLGQLFLGLKSLEIAATLGGILIVTPVTMVGYFYLTENYVASVLSEEDVARVLLPEESRRAVGFRWRFLATIGSVVLMPLGVFGYLLMMIAWSYIEIQLVLFHVIALILLFVVTVTVVSGVAAASFLRTVASMQDTARNLAAGDFRGIVPQLSTDELGETTIYFNQIVQAVSNVLRSIRAEAAHMTEVSRRLANGSRGLTTNTQEQASSSEEISAALEQMAASGENVTKNAREQSDEARQADQEIDEFHSQLETVHRNAGQAAERAEMSYQKAAEGEEYLEATVQTMQEISQNTDRIVEAMQLINEVADRVNLLSLNASIEAARAGEYGRGFAVVADEVSRLADRTQEHGQTILELVNHAVERSREGMQSIQETSRVFQEIIRSTRENKNLIDGITKEIDGNFKTSDSVRTKFAKVQKMSSDTSNALDEQSRTNRELTEGLHRISIATTAITEAAEEVARLSGDLADRASQLDSDIQFFKV